MKVFDKVGGFISKNQSGIALGVGLAFSVIGAIFTAKAAVKSKELIEEAKVAEDIPEEEDLTVKEKAKICWKEWVPAVLSYSFSFACILYGKRIDGKRLAAASVAYECLDRFSKEYASKVKEQLGEEKEKAIRDEIRDEREIPEIFMGPSEDSALYEGDSRFSDPYLNKIFITNSLKLEDNLNEYNQRLLLEGEAALNDFYDGIYERTPCGLNRNLVCELGNYLGFKFSEQKGLLELAYSDKHRIINGKRVPVTEISFVYKKTGEDAFPREIM